MIGYYVHHHGHGHLHRALVLADAVLRAVHAATGLAGPGLPSLPAARDLPGSRHTT